MRGGECLVLFALASGCYDPPEEVGEGAEDPPAGEPLARDACLPPYVATATGCYHLVRTSVTWQAASDACREDGPRSAHLAVLDSAAEHAWAQALLGGTAAWIGLVRTAAGWTWVTGRVPAFDGWLSGEPDADGACARFEDGWNDDQCFDHHAYLCERDGLPAAVVGVPP